MPKKEFGDSPSRGYYNQRENKIGISSSLKTKPTEVLKILRFELINARTQDVFADIHAQIDKEVETGGVGGYEGIPMFDPREPTAINVQLGMAKRVVLMERVEYQNVILVEKLARDRGERSDYHKELTGGVNAPWSSFANYLRDMCKAGHYISYDKNVKKATWLGWRFVTANDSVPTDPLV